MRYILIFFMFFETLFSQNKPNYEEIKINIKNHYSNLYYPVLLKRFNDSDITLTLNEINHIYYGYIYEKKLNEDDYLKLNESINKLTLPDGSVTEQNLDEYLVFIDLILEKYPISVSHLNAKKVILEYQMKDHEAQLIQDKIKMIFFAINNSGDGLTEETAFHILDREDERHFLSFYNVISDSYLTHPTKKIDVHLLEENEKMIEELYFNIEKTIFELKFN